MEQLRVDDIRRIKHNGVQKYVTLLQKRTASENEKKYKHVKATIEEINKQCVDYVTVTLSMEKYKKTGKLTPKDFEALKLQIGSEVQISILKYLDQESLRSANERLDASRSN